MTHISIDDTEFDVQWKRLNNRIMFLKEDEQKRAIELLKRQFLRFSILGGLKNNDINQFDQQHDQNAIVDHNGVNNIGNDSE